MDYMWLNNSITAGSHHKVLVVATETLSKVTDNTDRTHMYIIW
jgi:3-oxoacyl-[acyl-carrier-protein] synthase III